MQVAAVEAPPDHLGIPLENLSLFNVGGKVPESFFVLFFRDGNRIENAGDAVEALFTGNPRKLG